ncbi:hypothetical protein Cantr_08208 [Candida viswanathii]|uniref:Pirin n=1 Tax=Candida viswanathii TaxID=5486 RepID=A0A367Y4H1_9ASCO|nr:hypothetical protein Cantr_08208 [Candida viswanathii]
MSLRPVERLVTSRRLIEGNGAIVYRSLGIFKLRYWDPILFFDHFIVHGNKGFQAHPHIGHETITYVLNGAVAHEDFTGAKGILYPGDLQFMTAGKGIVHSEMPVTGKDGSPSSGLQIWVDLPADARRIDPGYRDLPEWETPVVESPDGKVSVRVVSGKSFGIENVKQLAYIPVDFYHFTVKPGGEFKQELKSDYNYILYVIHGNSLELNGKDKVVQHQNALLKPHGGDFIAGKNLATEAGDDVEFALIGGTILDQETHNLETMVGSTEVDVRKGIVDYVLKRNSFEKLNSWESLISDGVTEEMIQGPLNGRLEVREARKKAYIENLKKEAEAESGAGKEEVKPQAYLKEPKQEQLVA